MQYNCMIFLVFFLKSIADVNSSYYLLDQMTVSTVYITNHLQGDQK